MLGRVSMKSMLKSFLVSFMIIIVAVIIYVIFARTSPITSQKEDNIDYPLVETIKLISKENTINIMAYGEVISAKIIKEKCLFGWSCEI